VETIENELPLVLQTSDEVR
jgi:hypothetical protein